MRAKEFTVEAAFGTNPKRPARAGSRPDRGHEPQQRYTTPDFEERRRGKSPADLGGADAWYHRGDNPHYYGFEKGTPEYAEYMKSYNEWDEGPSGGKQWDEGFEDENDLDYLQGYYSDFHKDLHGFRPRHHSEEEWNDPDTLKKLIHGLHDYMDKLKQSSEGRAQLKADGWHFDDETNECWLQESKQEKKEPPKPRNFVAKNAINTGAGAHKDKKKAEKQGDTKHKKNLMDLAEMEDLLEKASRQLCKSSTPDEDLGASNLASCKSQGLRARDGNKSHKLGKSPKSRTKMGGHKIKGRKYGGPLPDWS